MLFRSQLNTIVTITGTDLFGGGQKISAVTLSGVPVVEISKNTDSQLIVVAQDAPSYNICPVVCHGTCSTCSTAAVDACTQCPGSRRMKNGECTSICDAKTYRKDGQVSATSTISFPGLLEGGFDNAQQRGLETTMQSLIKKSFDAIKFADDRLKDTSTSAKASIVAMEKFGTGVGLEIQIRVVCDHMFYEEVAGSITDMVGDGSMLKELKAQSKAYFYVTKLKFAEQAKASTEQVCQPCHGTCAGCNGPTESDCVACPADKVRYEGKCLNICPGGTFHDKNDDQCKPTTCEDGDAVATANTGAIVRAANTWRYVKRGEIESVTPSSGQVTTPVIIAGTGLRGDGAKVAKVLLANVEAKIQSQADDKVSVVVAANTAGKGNVLLLSSSGATVTRVNGWTHLEAGKFAKATPNEGQIGTKITISGSNLLLGGKKVVAVSLGSVAVEKIVSGTDEGAIVVVVGKSPGAGSAEIVEIGRANV